MKNHSTAYLSLTTQYHKFKLEELHGRYLTYDHIQPILDKLYGYLQITEIGTSALGNPIHQITLGKGSVKVLGWSQMHGNESTTTKAVFDILNAFILFPENTLIENILENITFKVIPMLNPDGARAYTRVNANDVDLNRDAFNLQEIESQILRRIFNEFEPDFCFNLHDQRTIFSAGNEPNPATISFLTPAMNIERDIDKNRERSMKVIAAMNDRLTAYLPGQIGRYDDGYNSNCTGDTFQGLGVPTILFEAGHYKDDYHREITRKYIAMALLYGLSSIATENWKNYSIEAYFQIPENEKLFYDVILRNAKVRGEVVDVGIQFKEELKEGFIDFTPVVQTIQPKLGFFAHREIDCNCEEVFMPNKENLNENVVVDKVFKNNEVLIIKFIKR